jgi:hypothetical protein
MPTLFGEPIFTVERTTYVWDDVVLAAQMWGDWTVLERRVRDGLACLARLDEMDEADEGTLDEADVDAAATEFRYARDLVAAADLEAWLDRRGITIDAWLDFIRRSLLLERWADDLDKIRDEYELDDDEVAEAVLCEALCGGVARHLAERLAARAAIQACALEEAGAVADVIEPRETRLSRLDATWQRFTAAVAPPDALRKLIAARRLDWMRVRGRAVVAPNVEVARELMLCVREDGRAIEEIAEEAGLRAETIEWWLEDVEPSLRDALAGAMPGDVLGPLAWKEAHLVLAVDDKRLPSEDDALVRARAERALLARTVDHEVARRVIWRMTL